jgi:transitional endoplasmic reticulum ATPase
MTSGFIPRCQADLEEILLGEASEKLRQGVPVEESMVKYAKTLEILPFQYSVNGYSGDLFQDYIKPYFVDNYLKVRLGDTFSTRGGNWAPQFKVVAIEGFAKQEGEYYIVGPDTQIECRRGVR